MTADKIKWIVRPTTSQDEEAINALLKLSFEALLPNDYSYEILEKSLPLMTTARPDLLTSGTWFLVEHPNDGTVVGCGGWTLHPPLPQDHQPCPHLRHFGTHPNYLRMGVGKAIWKRIWKEVVSTVGEETPLEVYSTITGRDFYASLGFVDVKHMTLPLDPDHPFPCVLMRRPAGSRQNTK